MSDTPHATQTVVDLTIAAPLETVWRALREPAQIANWFGWDAASLAEEIQFIFVDGAVADEANHTVQFGEWEGASDAIVLSAEVGHTRLRLLRTGGAALDWSGRYDDIAEGWVTFFQQLRFALEQHPGEQRRTIYLSGPSQPGVGQPSSVLGLGEAAAQGHSVRLDTGDSASGEVWYRTGYQTGLTVEQWGDGLLVVSDMGISTNRPQGGSSVLLTTYGLSDAEFAALEQRWAGWWGQR